MRDAWLVALPPSLTREPAAEPDRPLTCTGRVRFQLQIRPDGRATEVIVRYLAGRLFRHFSGALGLLNDLWVNVYFASEERFECGGSPPWTRRRDSMYRLAGSLVADDALRISPNAPKAASGEDWFADNHLAETLAGKAPDAPIERRRILELLRSTASTTLT